MEPVFWLHVPSQLSTTFFGTSLSRGNSYPFPIRNTFVPQIGQVPCVAFLPFLNVTGLGLRISRFVLHFTQYASITTSTITGWAHSRPGRRRSARVAYLVIWWVPDPSCGGLYHASLASLSFGWIAFKPGAASKDLGGTNSGRWTQGPALFGSRVSHLC